jgi:prepilin-type N-terminal cleavage/methylation domain-containing protein
MNGLRKETTQRTQQRGFTIIEVVLVLAIAGLIFLMVFIALPALQASQRDTARKNDVGTVAAAVTSFSGNNRGAFPTQTNIITYVTNVSQNSQTTAGKPNIVVKTAGVQTFTTNDTEIDIVQKAVCPATISGASITTTLGTTRQFVVVTHLEAGGGVAYCQDS